ncbi:piggyBac transposable element-derived protein 4-like [Acyrthosiphon pisum]|uniref:PiggyBac transposable element-derived protein domain-containing protein n=1 Tax=Acyrthosiphon pisum TaxID=7029 RepID=A0A8R2NM47_ACYPI|nr:piggyBac transposable element-derived protein 4-like [Acyrthosiphon pisum]
MSNVYYPGKELSLDESMILWQGRLLFRQFIQNKRHKYGIKLYMLTEPNGIILKFAVYTGATDDLGGKGHAANVVLHLMEEKLNTGHSIFMDNFYNSYDLAQKLLEKHTYCTGTLRANRVNTPKDVVNAKLKVGETLSKYSNNVMIGKWKDKREVTYISSEFQNDMVPTTNRKGRETLKPLPIKHYNKFMSGIDRQDQMISYYPFSRKTIRWYKKLGIHIIQMLLLNSYNLYNQYNIGTTLSLYDFRIIVLSKPEAPSKSLSIENHLPSTHGMGM